MMATDIPIKVVSELGEGEQGCINCVESEVVEVVHKQEWMQASVDKLSEQIDLFLRLQLGSSSTEVVAGPSKGKASVEVWRPPPITEPVRGQTEKFNERKPRLRE